MKTYEQTIIEYAAKQISENEMEYNMIVAQIEWVVKNCIKVQDIKQEEPVCIYDLKGKCTIGEDIYINCDLSHRIICKFYKPRLVAVKEQSNAKLLNMKVQDTELSVRSLNCLMSADIETIGDLVTWSKRKLSRIRNFGKISINEVEKMLESKGLRLDMYNTNEVRENTVNP